MSHSKRNPSTSPPRGPGKRQAIDQSAVFPSSSSAQPDIGGDMDVDLLGQGLSPQAPEDQAFDADRFLAELDDYERRTGQRMPDDIDAFGMLWARLEAANPDIPVEQATLSQLPLVGPMIAPHAGLSAPSSNPYVQREVPHAVPPNAPTTRITSLQSLLNPAPSSQTTTTSSSTPETSTAATPTVQPKSSLSFLLNPEPTSNSSVTAVPGRVEPEAPNPDLSVRPVVSNESTQVVQNAAPHTGPDLEDTAPQVDPEALATGSLASGTVVPDASNSALSGQAESRNPTGASRQGQTVFEGPSICERGFRQNMMMEGKAVIRYYDGRIIQE
ncbi:hypothetical protein BJ508DRAFT_335182 [Ascobolus immersus RN42]|uniref:Uncharacterized protein n=1 Tax=Ascobolus immersus RN42 TaxID=1160509 RepID=A0A3N4HDD1_ASCIM|nr:hypothetical protein BJ508DRAFT_335182 [Ascobolus immersus RN42]